MTPQQTAPLVTLLLCLGLSACDNPDNAATQSPAAQTPTATTTAPEQDVVKQPDPVQLSGDYFTLEDGSAMLRRCDDGTELNVVANNQTMLLTSSLERDENRAALPVTVEGYLRKDGQSIELTDLISIGEARLCGAPAADLLGSYWKLVSITDLASLPTGLREEPNLVLSSDGSFNGHDGCNGMFGQYLLDGANLSFQGVAATRMACPDIDTVETAFQNVVERAGKYRIEGQTLTLETSDGTSLATFEATAITQ